MWAGAQHRPDEAGPVCLGGPDAGILHGGQQLPGLLPGPDGAVSKWVSKDPHVRRAVKTKAIKILTFKTSVITMWQLFAQGDKR